MAAPREVNESPLYQGANEALAYNLTVTPWGVTPTNVVLTVTDITTAESPVDVTATTLSGSTSIVGNVITTKRLSGLTLTRKYRLDMRFTDADSNTWEAFAIILCR